jgi:ParB family transcriptional regulator, chromosome partitioning protein
MIKVKQKVQPKSSKRALGRGLSALISPAAVSIKENMQWNSQTSVASNELVFQNEDVAENNYQEYVGNISIHEAPAVVLSVARAVEGDIDEKDISFKDGAKGSGSVLYLPVDAIVNNLEQPRREFNEDELQDLVHSIKSLGLLQPIIVKEKKNGPCSYEIVAGERRWRAARSAGLEEVPVIVKNLTDIETLQVALVENIQRQQLNPIEEALAYDKFITDFQLTHDEIAELVGKSRVSISNILRLLKLPKEIRNYVTQGNISLGHAKVILSLKDQNAQLSLAKKVMAESLSVRQLEELVSRIVVLDSGTSSPANKIKGKKHLDERSDNSAYHDLVNRLRERLGTKIAIHSSLKKEGNAGGKVVIDYFNDDDLTRIVDTICETTAFSD